MRLAGLHAHAPLQFLLWGFGGKPESRETRAEKEEDYVIHRLWGRKHLHQVRRLCLSGWLVKKNPTATARPHFYVLYLCNLWPFLLADNAKQCRGAGGVGGELENNPTCSGDTENDWGMGKRSSWPHKALRNTLLPHCTYTYCPLCCNRGHKLIQKWLSYQAKSHKGQ